MHIQLSKAGCVGMREPSPSAQTHTQPLKHRWPILQPSKQTIASANQFLPFLFPSLSAGFQKFPAVFTFYPVYNFQAYCGVHGPAFSVSSAFFFDSSTHKLKTVIRWSVSTKTFIYSLFKHMLFH